MPNIKVTRPEFESYWVNRKRRRARVEGVGGLGFTNKLAVRPVTSDAAGLVTFDTWYGKAADFVTVFNSHTSWVSYLSSIDDIVTNFAGDTRPKVWTIGPNITGTTLAAAAAGDFDTYYTQAAQKIAADPPAGVILVRVGHEFNLTGTYPWEVIASGAFASYVTAFRRLVNCFRAVSTRFRFIWNPNWISTGTGSPSYDVTQCWPGGGYVDALGTDLYYNSALDDVSADVAFNYSRDLAGYGLQAMATLASGYGKPMVFCEFGLNWDKPRWIDLMWKWATDHNFAYSGYFDANPDYSWQLSGGAYPDAGARFKADFRDGGPIPLFNHTFLVDTEFWAVKGAGTVARVSNALQISNGGNFSNGGQRTWTGLTIGATYAVRADINTGNKNARLVIAEASSPFTNLSINTYNNNALQTKEFTFVATQTSVNIQGIPYAGDAAQIVTLDNVKLFLGSVTN